MVRGKIHEFDLFCPKAIGMMGLACPAPRPAALSWSNFGRSCRASRPLTFAIPMMIVCGVTAQGMRWAADNAAALKDANPVMPPGFSNRLAMNWRLPLAIADLAGGTWPKQGRAAAVKLSHNRHRQSEGIRLLAALRPIFATRAEITSAELVAKLNADPDEEWSEFRDRGPITQRQVAALLSEHDIFPVVLHPTKRAGLSRRGYRRSQFDDVFARFLPHDPNIRTLTGRKPRKTKENR